MELGARVVRFSVDHPRLVVGSMVAVTLVIGALAGLPTLFPEALSSLPSIAVDTDPENMLAGDEPARVRHRETKKTFALHDMVVLGVVNETHPQGVFNPGTLAAVHRLTEKAKTLDGVIAADVMSISTVDSIENAGAGLVRFEWMMAAPPETDAQANAIARKVERIPFLRDSIASSNDRALAIYVPVAKKSHSRAVAIALEEEIGKLPPGDDRFHITGLPVAEDTFGVQMFIQMGISAPIAMFVIFLLLWIFFRKVVVIASPLILAMVCSIQTMGLLIVSGNTVHIMSSMIPIFIMPIAVLDAIHIISEFFDLYPTIKDRRATILHAMNDLFAPMLFTSLTTAAGFASLALTPIPPVRVFGLFVAAGVILAWMWTVMFIPAFVMLISAKTLGNFGMQVEREGILQVRILRGLGRFAVRRAKPILLAVVLIGAFSAYGMSLIRINDNPTNWFEPAHPIRVADRVLNKHFAGTYQAYLHLRFAQDPYDARSYGDALAKGVELRRAGVSTELGKLGARIAELSDADNAMASLEGIDDALRIEKKSAADPHAAASVDAAREVLGALLERLEESSEPVTRAALGAMVVERAKAMDTSFVSLTDRIRATVAAAPDDEATFRTKVSDGATGPAAALISSFAQRNEVFKDPALLAYVERLSAALTAVEVVGKSTSMVDIVKTVHRDLTTGEEVDYRIPDNRTIIAQSLTQFQSSHRKDDLWHFVTPDYTQAVLWLQLKRGDNRDMALVLDASERFFAENEPPVQLQTPAWTGLTYINLVWQDRMVSGMLNAFLGSFVVVLLMMVLLFRSVIWGLLSMIPLTVTVGLIYGLVGLLGKDYDMPVAVLSSLSLGLSIDYAIHFLVRARALRATSESWEAANRAAFAEPARAIGRNAIVVGVGFLPLLLTPLVPYQTVGTLIAAILITAGVATLVVLPAMLTVLQNVVFPANEERSG